MLKKQTCIDEFNHNIDKIVDTKDRKLLFKKDGTRKKNITGTKKRKIELIENAGIEYFVEKGKVIEDFDRK